MKREIEVNQGGCFIQFWLVQKVETPIIIDAKCFHVGTKVRLYDKQRISVFSIDSMNKKRYEREKNYKDKKK